MPNTPFIPELEDRFANGRTLAIITIPYLGIKLHRLSRVEYNVSSCGFSEYIYPFRISINYGQRKDKTEPILYIYHTLWGRCVPFVKEILTDMALYTAPETFKSTLHRYTGYGNDDHAYQRFRIVCYKVKTFQQLQDDNIYYMVLRTTLNRIFTNENEFSFQDDLSYRFTTRTSFAYNISQRSTNTVISNGIY
jgi:hypothetical protein